MAPKKSAPKKSTPKKSQGREVQASKENSDDIEYSAELLNRFSFNVSTGNYEDFINSFRTCNRQISSIFLVSSIDDEIKREVRPLLESVRSVRKFKYFDVEFKVENDEGVKKSCHCRFKTSYLYLFGFSPDGVKWFELSGWNDLDVKDLPMTHLPGITISYGCLEKITKKESLWIDRDTVKSYVGVLADYKEGEETNQLKNPLLLITQIFSEAIRIPAIMEKIALYFDKGGINLGKELVDMENNYQGYCVTFIMKLLEEEHTGIAMKDDDFNRVAVILPSPGVAYEECNEELKEKKGKRKSLRETSAAAPPSKKRWKVKA